MTSTGASSSTTVERYAATIRQSSAIRTRAASAAAAVARRGAPAPGSARPRALPRARTPAARTMPSGRAVDRDRTRRLRRHGSRRAACPAERRGRSRSQAGPRRSGQASRSTIQPTRMTAPQTASTVTDHGLETPLAPAGFSGLQCRTPGGGHLVALAVRAAGATSPVASRLSRAGDRDRDRRRRPSEARHDEPSRASRADYRSAILDRRCRNRTWTR